ncbi:MAG: phytanoyl-CoA dioxygenase family protein [Gammaproteobacteria bacterium]
MFAHDDIYPTRGIQERLTERKDPILYGWDYSPKKLTETQLVHYERHGFVAIPAIFSTLEVACFNDAINRIAKRKREKGAYWKEKIPPGESESLFFTDQAGMIFQDLVRERRILDGVMQILGGPVYLHRSRIHVENGEEGSSYPWHSAFESWHAEDGIPRMRGVEAWIMLNESSPAAGSLRVLSKSHQIYAATRNESSVYDDGQSIWEFGRLSLETLERLLQFGELTDVYGSAGTLVICDCNLLYGSAKGLELQRRATAMFSYNSMENLPAEQPFAAEDFRPEPIVCRGVVPLQPKAFNFARWNYDAGGSMKVSGKRTRVMSSQPRDRLTA